MSVQIEVELDTGASMAFNRSYMATGGASAGGVLRELDKGYNQIRSWLFDQLSPAEQAKVDAQRVVDQTKVRPMPEERSVKEVVRETIQDDAKRAGRWHR